MNDLQPDESYDYGLSNDETLFLSYQKIPVVKIAFLIQRRVISID